MSKRHARITQPYGVVYLRVSDVDQESLPEQLEMTTSAAAKHGVTIPKDGIYVDRGNSRDMFLKREGLQEMLKRTEDPNCTHVFVWIYSRLYSGMEMQMDIFRILRRTGTRLFDSRGEEQNTDDHSKKLTEAIDAWKSEGELREVRRRVRETHASKARSARLIQRPPYGITVIELLKLPCAGRCIDGGKGCPIRHGEVSSKNGTVWIVNEEQVAVLNMLYQWAANGIGFFKMTQLLEERGIVAPVRTVKRGKNEGATVGGKPWSQSNLRKMLLNRFYRGEFIWNQSSIQRPTGDLKIRVPNPPEEWIVREHALGPIVDTDLFDAAARQIEMRRHTREEGRRYDVRLFDQIVYCGRCGWKMSPRKRAQKLASGEASGLFDYWCSGTYNPYSKCERNHWIPESWLYRLFGMTVTDRAARPRVDVTFEMGKPVDTEPEMKVLEGRLKEAGDELGRLRVYALKGLFDEDTAMAMKAELDERVAKIEARRDELLAIPKDVPRTPEAPVVLQELVSLVDDERLPMEERRRSLTRLVDRIVVDRPGVRVVLLEEGAEAEDFAAGT